MPLVRYTPDGERPLEHEQQPIDEITHIVHDTAAHVADTHGHASATRVPRPAFPRLAQELSRVFALAPRVLH